jgi:hypothetical protein
MIKNTELHRRSESALRGRRNFYIIKRFLRILYARLWAYKASDEEPALDSFSVLYLD